MAAGRTVGQDGGMTILGAIFPPDLPPERLRPVAQAADAAGLEQLWLWEDCFAESGIAAAAAVLGWTGNLAVGIGLLPVPLRNVALTAMELATLERLFPARLVAGIGHGVSEWMGQVGARPDSPMTLLREYTESLRALLDGSPVTVAGRYVQLDAVRLAWPPAAAPPLLVGGIGPRTISLAGELSDGVILTGETTPAMLAGAVAALAEGRRLSGRHGTADVVAFIPVDGNRPAAELAAVIGQFTAAGATHAILHSVGDGPELERFVQLLAGELRPLVP
jgi:alkanesulfonate monooxygenase SsuD/methylene tetrahydromethanopterin reductase-like flavin-dependent oxidoreductase (luciferase family)